jgi:hypothetical protein
VQRGGNHGAERASAACPDPGGKTRWGAWADTRRGIHATDLEPRSVPATNQGQKIPHLVPGAHEIDCHFMITARPVAPRRLNSMLASQ